MASNEKYVMHFDTGRGWRGGQDQVFLLVSGLREYGIRQLVVTPAGSSLEDKVRGINVGVKNIDPLNDLDIMEGLRFRSIVKRETPGIVHFHTSRSLGIGSWSLRGLKLKTVATRRVDLPVSRNPLNTAKYRYPDSVVVISDFIKDYFIRIGFGNVERIYSSVDLARFRFDRGGSKGGALNVGMIGAFDLRHKDFISFIRSADMVKKRNTGKKISFLIAGRGRDEDKIEDCVRDMGLQGDVGIVGFVPDIEGFLSSLDILVHTVNFEGLGTVILQAMAAGLPVIGTRVGGIPELVKDGENGFLVEKGDYRDVALKIQYLIDNPELMGKFGEKGRRIVESKFSSARMTRQYLDLYNRI
jgi:glycosyltransferase involved in cell wall biosynthesis